MATKIETLKKPNGDQVLPRTRAKAVSMEDGTTVEAAINAHTADLATHVTNITNQINSKADADHTHDYEDLENKPNITTDEADDSFSIADSDGNIVAKVDEAGLKTTTIKVTDKATTLANIGAAPAGYGYGGEVINLGTTASSTEGEVQVALAEIYNSMALSEAKQISLMCSVFGDWSIVGTLFKSSLGYATFTGSGTKNGHFSVAKNMYDGAWLPFEWVNPPFEPEVSYRTTERFNKQPVYKKLTTDGVTMWSVDNSTWYYETQKLGKVGQGLSTNDFSNAYKTKLNGIETSATLGMCEENFESFTSVENLHGESYIAPTKYPRLYSVTVIIKPDPSSAYEQHKTFLFDYKAVKAQYDSYQANSYQNMHYVAQEVVTRDGYFGDVCAEYDPNTEKLTFWTYEPGTDYYGLIHITHIRGYY